MECTLNNSIYKSGNYTDSDSLLLTLATNTPVFANWYGNRPIELINDEFINDNGERISANQLLNNINAKRELLYEDKPDDYLSNVIAQLIGIEPFEDEIDNGIITERELILNQKVRNLLNGHVNIINDENNLMLHGDNVINLAHLSINDSFLMYYPAFISEKEANLVNFILKDIGDDTQNWTDKKIIVSNLLTDYAALPLETQRKLYKLATIISNKLGVTDRVISPNQEVMSFLEGMIDVETLDDLNYIVNRKEITKELNDEYKKSILSPFRKVIFSVILDNLKEKFGVNYRWVNGDNTFHARLVNGVVEINENNFNDSTPFHEYLHPIVMALKVDNIELYNQLISNSKVRKLTNELSQIEEYKDDAEEEALVRHLTNNFKELTFSVTFEQFWIWLKNLMKRLFKINSEKLSLSSSIDDITNLMLNAHKYDVSSFKLHPRYSFNRYELGKVVMKSNNLTTEQQNVMTNLAKIEDRIKDYEISITDKAYMLTPIDPNITETFELKRITAIKKFDFVGSSEPAIIGSFLHDLFTQYLRLRINGKTPTQNGENFVKPLKIDKKFSKKKNEDIYILNYVNDKDTIQEENDTYPLAPYNTVMYQNINEQYVDRLKNENPFTHYILKNIKYPDAGTKTTEESNVLQQIYRDISDQDIYYLYQMMVNMENHIINTINNVENTKVTLDDLVIYNEMFIHNFDKSSIGSQLYGGTLDIFVISPSGRKYNFDIKTTGTSKMRANNKELIKSSNIIYALQQSAYRELISFITDEENLAPDIETYIIHMPRGVDYNYKPDTFKDIVTKLLEIINNPSIDFDSIRDTVKNIKVTKDELKTLLNNSLLFINGDESKEIAQDFRTINNLLKNILFKNVEHTIGNNPNAVLIEKLIEAVNYELPFHDNNVLDYKRILDNKTGTLDVDEIAKIIPIKYNRRILETEGVKILHDLSYHPFVIELNGMVDDIRKKLFLFQVELNNIKDSKDTEDIIEAERIRGKIERLNHYKDNIVAKLINIFTTNTLTDADIAKYKSEIYPGKWKIFRSLLFKDSESDNYLSYIKASKSLKRDVDNSKETLENIKKARNENIKRLEKTRSSLYNQIQTLLASRNITITPDGNFLKINDPEINSLNDKLLATIIEMEKLEKDNILLTSHINSLDLNARILNENIKELSEKGNIQTIIDDANFHYEKINELIIKMSDPTIPLDIRASYYDYITKTVDLYKKLISQVPGDVEFSPELNNTLIKIQTKYEQLLNDDSEVNINDLFKIIISDLINSVKPEGVKLIQENHLIETTLQEYKIWNDGMSILYHAHSQSIRDFVDNNINSFNTQLNNSNARLKEYYENNREIVSKRIDEELKMTDPSRGVNWLNEHFLPGNRSKYVLVSLFSILESEINGEYSVIFDKLSNEAQTAVATLFGKFSNKITNKVKIGTHTFADEEYEVFEKHFIARTTNQNLIGDVDKSLTYLLNPIKSKYQYEFIFDDKEIRALQDLTEDGKKSYIVRNNLIEKYKIVNTMRLVDRVIYGYMDTIKEEEQIVKQYIDIFRKSSPKSKKYNLITLKEKLQDFLNLKKENTIQYNAINFHFMSYILHINEFIGKMNDMHHNKFQGQKIYDSSNLISEDELTYVNELLVKINESDSINTIDFKRFFADSTTIIGKSLYNAIVNVSDDNLLINEIEDELKQYERDRLVSIYGTNYANIFYKEGLDNFASFYGNQSVDDGSAEKSRKTTLFNRLASKNKAKMIEKLDQLKLRDKNGDWDITDTKTKEIVDRYELMLNNKELLFLMRYSPFNYILSVNNADDANVFDLITGYKVEDLAHNIGTGYQYNIEDYMSLTMPKGYMNITENGNEKHLDSNWNIMEDPQNEELFNFYSYFRETMKYFYSIIPYQERNYGTDIDIPFMSRESKSRLFEDMVAKGFDLTTIKEYLQNNFYKSITSSVQSTQSEPAVMMKPVQIKDIEELYHTVDKANYQLHTILQMYAYNALLYKTRVDKRPLHNIILNVARQSKNDEIKDGAIFGNHVNMTGSVQRNINKESPSHLSTLGKRELDKVEAMILKYEDDIKLIESQKETAKANNDYDLLKELQIKGNILSYKQLHYKRLKRDILNGSKLDYIDITRETINVARLVQLTYSLTGQIGNYINGMIQSSVVASGSDKEMKAYIESFRILNGLLFENKLLLGSAYAGNMVTSSLLGTAAGLISIPIWMTLAQSGLEKYKNLSWLKTRFNDEVKKALNMERTYNLTFDVVELQRAGLPQNLVKVWDAKRKQVVQTSDDFIELIKPFGFVKRAEKLIAIQNMIIQGMINTTTINGVELTFWDLHNEDGVIKPEYAPFVSQSFIDQWKRQTEDRLYRSNGNYTSKYQVENYWWGQLLLVYSKWIPEIARNYWGGYTSEERNIFSGEAHEGIGRSFAKKAWELQYNLLRNKMVGDFVVSDEIIKDTEYGDIIIYRNGEIIRTATEKSKFIDDYNNIINEANKNGETVDIDVLKGLVKTHDIKILNTITPEEKTALWSKLKDVAISFITPFDFIESFKQRTLTRNVSGRLSKILPNGENLIGYQKVQYANLRRAYNILHVTYSVFLTKTLLMVILGYLTKVLDLDDDEQYVKQLTFMINRYNQIWEDVTYFNNPVSAFYNYFHNSMSTVKFMLDFGAWSKDVGSVLPHALNGILGDSEMGDILLESMGMREPILEKSKGITTIRPINDFVDMIPLFNKLASLHKQTVNDYSNMQD